MCGRLALTLPPEAVRAYFRYVEQPNFPPRYNIAPTQPTPIVRMERRPDGSRERHFMLARWAFTPGFVRDPNKFPLVINARAETVLERASFRNAMRRRRCIFVADAFYEWLRDRSGARGKARRPPTPYLIRRRDGAPMAIAGLWETWSGPNGEEVDTACIVTTHANGMMAAVHDRMPVILEPADFDRWLDPDLADAEEAHSLARPADEDVLEMFEIAPLVNKVANDGPELQTPVRRTPAPGAQGEATGEAKGLATGLASRPARGGKTPGAQGDLFG